MGEIADQMINGEICAECGVSLSPKEEVYVQGGNQTIKIPSNGDAAGIPVVCFHCKD